MKRVPLCSISTLGLVIWAIAFMLCSPMMFTTKHFDSEQYCTAGLFSGDAIGTSDAKMEQYHFINPNVGVNKAGMGDFVEKFVILPFKQGNYFRGIMGIAGTIAAIWFFSRLFSGINKNN